MDEIILTVLVSSLFDRKNYREVKIRYSVVCTILEKIECLEPLQDSDIIKELIIPSSYTNEYGVKRPIYTVNAHLADCGFDNMYIENLYIEDGIENITKSAFANCEGISSVRWPSTCETIPESCFSGCDTLAAIENIDKVSDIGDEAFAASNLFEFKWPSLCKTIPARCFYNCKALKTITGIGRVTKIRAKAFYSCHSLRSFTWPRGCSVIPEYCFSECNSLRELIIKNKISNVGMYAFAGTLLESFIWPASCNYIPIGCFRYCYKLKSIKTYSTLKHIYSYAFDGTHLESFDASKLIVYIDDEAFPNNCKVIKSIYQ